MSQIHRFAIAGLCCLAAAVAARGDVSIPHVWKTAPTIEPAWEKTIDAYVAENAKKLKSDDPAVIKDGREKLVEGARAGAQELSPAYASVYAESVNRHMSALLNENLSVRSRLNVAVVVARVAEATHNTRFEASILKLLNAKQHEAVKLWGVKAARSILPDLIKIKSHKRLMEEVIDAAHDHPHGPMAFEAYEALTSKSIDKADAAATVGPLLELASARVGEYKMGVPEDPAVDRVPFYFLTQQGIWDTPVLGKDKQVHVMQLAVDVLVYAAYQADQPGCKQRDELAQLLGNVAEAVTIAARLSELSQLETLARMIPGRVRAAPGALAPIVAPLAVEIQNTPQFKKVVIPAPSAASTQPAN